MRKFILLAVFALVASVVAAQTLKRITLQWDDPNTADVGVLEYVLYESTEGGDPQLNAFNEVARIPVGTLTSLQDITLDTGKHWFYVTAVNAAGESGASNIVAFNANRPVAVRVVIIPR